MNARPAETDYEAFDKPLPIEVDRVRRVIEQQAQEIARAAGVDPSRVIIEFGRR
jgi:hypothetical protein